MTIEDIKKLVTVDESRTLELKKSTGELKDGMHVACAFLNTEGGWLILDVLLREQGIEEPVWSWNGAFVTVTFRRVSKVHNDTITSEAELEYSPNSPQARPKLALSSPQVRPKFAPSSPQVERLVVGMNDGYFSIREMVRMFEHQDTKHFREDYVKPALTEGAIERLYPDRPNHPKQKYKLTEAAKEWKERNMD